jgi:hypothetical protein
MNFLARFKQNGTAPAANDAAEEPLRRRTFSASQFRDEELARAAEIRAVREAAEAESIAAAEAVRAARIADLEDERAAEAADAGYAPANVAVEPMDWEEACGLLSTMSADARTFVAQHWNWEHDLRVLHFLVTQPDMDLGVAAGIFWLTGATDDFFPWGDDDCPEDAQFKRAQDMVEMLGRRFADEQFEAPKFGFDDSFDLGALKERLEALYLEGRIEWSPANLPTVSPGPQPTINDVPEDERQSVIDLLARHGAY